MKVYLLFELTDMSDYTDAEYNAAQDQERVLGVYFCEDEAEKDLIKYATMTESLNIGIKYEIREFSVK